MSKTLAICVAVLFVLSFAGCAGGQSTEPSAIPKTFLTPEPSPSAHLIALPEPTFSAIPEDIQSPSPEPTISAPPDRLNAQTSEPTNTPLIAVMSPDSSFEWYDNVFTNPDPNPFTLDESLFEPMPADFDFLLRYGHESRNRINTYNGSLTKDLVSAEPSLATIDFEIPAEKKEEMYQAFVQCEISKLPNLINDDASLGDEIVFSSLSSVIKLTYTCNGETRLITCYPSGPWDAVNGRPKSYWNLENFLSFVIDYVYSTEEYKNMPPAVGGYV